MPVRHIIIDITYRDDPHNPRKIDLRRDFLDQLETRLAAHLATPVDAWILKDECA